MPRRSREAPPPCPERFPEAAGKTGQVFHTFAGRGTAVFHRFRGFSTAEWWKALWRTRYLSLYRVYLSTRGLENPVGFSTFLLNSASRRGGKPGLRGFSTARENRWRRKADGGKQAGKKPPRRAGRLWEVPAKAGKISPRNPGRRGCRCRAGRRYWPPPDGRDGRSRRPRRQAFPAPRPGPCRGCWNPAAPPQSAG